MSIKVSGVKISKLGVGDRKNSRPVFYIEILGFGFQSWFVKYNLNLTRRVSRTFGP